MTVVLDDDAYYCLLVDALDNADTRTVSELLEEETEQDDDMQSIRFKLFFKHFLNLL